MQWSGSAKSSLSVIFVLLIFGLAGQVIWSSMQAEWLPRLSALALDHAGRVVIGLGDELIALDQTGAIASRHRLARAEQDAHDIMVGDIAFDRHGNYVIADRGNTAVKKYDANHRLIWSSGQQGQGKGEFWGTMKVAVHPQTGHVYATDTNAHRLHLFDANGHHLKTVGSKGSAPGQFQFPNGLRLDPDGQLFVVNTNARRIDRLDASGQHLESIMLNGFPAGCPYPVFMTLDDARNMYVIMGGNDLGEGWVYKFDRQGEFLLSFEYTGFPTELSGIVSLGNRILAADHEQWQLLAFRHDGKVLDDVPVSTALTKELQALRQKRQFYQRLQSTGQIGLIIACALVILLYLFQKWKAQQDAQASPSPWDHRLPPVRLPEAITARRIAGYTFTFATGLCLCVVMVMLNDDHLIRFAGKLMVFMCLGLWFVLAGGILLYRYQLQQQPLLIKKILDQLPIVIPETETIQAVIKLARGTRKGFRRWFSGRTIALATQQRLILIETHGNGHHIHTIWQLAYDQIISIDRPVIQRFQCAWVRTRVTITTQGKQKLICEAPRFELSGFTETLEQMRQNATPDALPSGHTHLEQIFPDTTVPAGNLPLRGALLSVLYPGIGQFYSGAFWKGVAFLIFYTLTLSMTLQLFTDWYFQYMEVPATLLFFLTGGLLFIWITAILDAYMEMSQRPGA